MRIRQDNKEQTAGSLDETWLMRDGTVFLVWSHMYIISGMMQDHHVRRNDEFACLRMPSVCSYPP